MFMKLEWQKKKKFRDPVHGYITIPEIYVEKIIDTPYMQRLKGISQTGIRPLYPSATHYRFAHSLGVYHFSMMAYSNLKNRILNDAKNRMCKDKDKDKLYSLKWDLSFWEVLLAVAALLHDIGHPAFSHPFEYLYDDVFMFFPDSECLNEFKGKFSPRRINLKNEYQYSVWQKITKKLQEISPDYDIKKSWLKKELAKYLKIPVEKIKGKPHERMSVYMILSGSKKEKNTLYNHVKDIIESYLDDNNQLSNYIGYNAGINRERLLKESVNFVCYMIIGQKYEISYKSEFCFENYRKSAGNCIINILNGIIDADSIDYTMRNAYTAGYDTHKVDYNRLCLAFSVFFENNILKSCFAGSAISVLEGFMSARNAEPTWLYSHHKVVYHDVLIKMLSTFSSRYLKFLDAKHHSRSSVRRDIQLGNSRIAELGFIPNEESIPYRFYQICMISPLIPYIGSECTISGSTDALFDTLFRAIGANLRKKADEKYKHFYSDEDNRIFRGLIKEYNNRKYKHSLWKSYPEYLVHIKRTAKELGISWAIANNYMMELILEKLQEIYIGRETGSKKISPEDDYVEQCIYTFVKEKPDNDVHPLPEEFKQDDFTNGNCVCKLVSVKYKDFNELVIDLGGTRTKLGDFPLSVNQNVPYRFPYFFIKCNNEREFESIKTVFWKSFKVYCSQKMEKNKKTTVSEVDMSLEEMHGFRDVIHGDITFPDKFWNVINTSEFQRLLRIKQLALTSFVFPTVNHTRYEHSIGACYVMRQVVERFKVLGLNIDSDDSDIAILATLLHDVGHGPFSHAFESVMKVKHEEWTKRIILESPGLTNAIEEGFGKEAPQRIVNCLSYKDSVKTTSPEKLNFSFIYSALVNGALDVDRIDYLLRDAYYTATKFGSIDISKIISAIKLASIDGVYHLCFDKAYLPYLEQLIFARKEMYNNVYCDSRKVLMETLVEKIIQRAYKVRDKLDVSDCKLLENLKNSTHMDVSEYLLLDDYTMYACFKRWHEDRKDIVLSLLTGSVLNKNLYKSALNVSIGSNERFDLLKDIGSLLELVPDWDILPDDTMPEECFAIFKMDKHVTIYPDAGIKSDAGKTITISNQNGEIEDFAKNTHFNFAEISQHYLFWSEEVLREVLKSKYTEEKRADNMVEQMKKLIESYKPRNHIEIERKYLCNNKVLELAEKLISGKLSTANNSFLLIEPFDEKEQNDTYFDTKDHMLLKKGCTLRIRWLGNKNYICTIKLPIESKSFGGSSPTARREYESAGLSDLDDQKELLKTQRNFIFKRLGSEGVVSDRDIDNLNPILKVRNNRKKGTVIGTNGNFKCEVCLDRVSYSRPYETNGIPDYQIEIELKSDYLTHVTLNQFTVKLEEMLRKESDDLKPTQTSKLERGLEQLDNSSIQE